MQFVNNVQRRDERQCKIDNNIDTVVVAIEPITMNLTNPMHFDSFSSGEWNSSLQNVRTYLVLKTANR